MATASELRAQLKAAEDAEREADRAKRKSQDEAWGVLTTNPDNWEWRATPARRQPFLSNAPALRGAVVEMRLKQDVLEAWAANGPATFSSDYEDKGRWFGMFYYRTDENILTHEGGGHLVLRDPKLCNDAEWADIRAGKPAAKFKRD
jgi:hypothetical protein